MAELTRIRSAARIPVFQLSGVFVFLPSMLGPSPVSIRTNTKSLESALKGWCTKEKASQLMKIRATVGIQQKKVKRRGGELRAEMGEEV